MIRDVLRVVPLDRLGQRIRAHRTACGLTIRGLAALAMVSKTSVVSLEQGRSCLPATLAKVCAAMNLHLERLVDPPDTQDAGAAHVHRSEDNRWYSLSGLATGPLAHHALTPEQRQTLRAGGPDALMTMFRNVPATTGVLAGVLEVTQATEPRSHPGLEFAYVLSGLAQVIVDEETYQLKPGDSIFIESMASHSYGVATGSKDPVSFLLFRFG